jgi:hypothetical protein
MTAAAAGHMLLFNASTLFEKRPGSRLARLGICFALAMRGARSSHDVLHLIVDRDRP